jgi:YesN/AraC family two-component response regulator
VKGHVTININGKLHMLQKDYCAILPPNSILRKVAPNSSYTMKIAAISSAFMEEFLSPSKETWHTMSYLYHNPVHPIKQRESYKMFLYKELLLTLTKEQPHVYSKQTRRYHLAGMLCEMMANLNKMVPDEKRKDINHNRAIVITRSFLELVNTDDGSHRSVCYYADRLCYSPKYLSFIIKAVTGKTPLQIINEHAIKQIKVKLRYTDISMKELADLFDFPNPSFFGKFVKMHTGMSPMQYRQSKEEV